MLRGITAFAVVLMLAGCAQSIRAPEEEVARAAYVGGPPSVTLFTVINDRNGSGAHSGLLINGSQRVLFDPAGTWSHPRVPERDDVHFGISEPVLNFYRDYHARDSDTETFHIVETTINLSPDVAELILQRALANGAVAKANCARSISALLKDVPGFENLQGSWFPKRLGKSFEQLPGATSRIVTEENDNPGQGHGVVLVDKKGNRVN
ncbi:hypothetical protein [Pseudogemmobacter faecipullorum]|uniref:Lipoprotein n=1 Tax=Pseudogemmobacter faecipullorum TaxID=2755041 RepID=A0ABS8CI97_9RHOB|nr:hypothetical protein [Pseudogemmobacter faecipullorum]MCB5408913.1 hypothetical protein [Pseudogemmobacter faecipullorum]